MKSVFKRLSAVLIAVMAMFCLSISAFAAGLSYDTEIVKCNKSLDAALVQKWVTSSGTEVLDPTYKMYKVQVDTSGGNFRILCNLSDYTSLTKDEQSKANAEMTNTVNSWGLSQEASQDVYNRLKNNSSLGISDSTLLTLIFSETKADLASAMKWFAPFNGTVGVILGVGVILIILFLVVSTVFDLVYLGIPMIRNAMDGGNKDGKDGKRPFGVSYDAVKCVEEVDGGGNGQGGGSSGNIYFLYFKRRVVTYIILAICILYLISGQIAGVIGWLMDLVSGFGN